MSDNKDSIGYSLNDKEMKDICDCKVITYTDLADYKNLDDLFRYNGRIGDSVVICFLTRANYGHWICLFKNADGINFFDSYGLKPDDELDWHLNEYFREEAKENYPHLTWLLYHSGLPINYNQYKFQSKDKGVATCGRWCIVRLSVKKLNSDQYRDYICKLCNNMSMDPDHLVTWLTAAS